MERARILGHARKLLCARAGGQRRCHPAGAHSGEERNRIFGARRAQNRHGLPALKACLDQSRGQPLDQTDQFGPVNLAAIIFQRDPIAFDAGPLHEDFGESAKGLGETGGYHIIVHGR